jgi:hypothetical protein
MYFIMITGGYMILQEDYNFLDRAIRFAIIWLNSVSNGYLSIQSPLNLLEANMKWRFQKVPL